MNQMQIVATMEARFAAASARPRDPRAVRARLLEECRRPRFADEARYSIPRGLRFDRARKEWVEMLVEGPSIRFAEAAAAALGNLIPQTILVSDGPDGRHLQVSVTDLESNLSYVSTVSVGKTSERRTLRPGQVELGRRFSGFGEPIYVVAATDEEVRARQAVEVSMALRPLILRFVPADLIEDCMTTCVATLQEEHANDPAASMVQICRLFAGRGITPEELALYVGHPLDHLSAAEAAHLRSFWASIRDGQSWDDALEERLSSRPPPATNAESAEPVETSGQSPTEPAKPTPLPRGTKAAKAAIKAAQGKPDGRRGPRKPRAAPVPPEAEAPAPEAPAPEPASAASGPICVVGPDHDSDPDWMAK